MKFYIIFNAVISVTLAVPEIDSPIPRLKEDNMVPTTCDPFDDDGSCCNHRDCGLGEGDCDKDNQCLGELICGKNNCKDFNPLTKNSKFDCCTKVCDPTNDDVNCCKNRICGLGEGDCDDDGQCNGDLVCGRNTCKYFHPLTKTNPKFDCCIEPQNQLNVLFIGNSFTFVNDVPKLVQELASADGRSMSYDEHTKSGWSWSKHWNSNETRSKIHRGGWDVIVMQEQTNRPAQPTVCEKSYPYIKLFSEEILQYNPEAKIQWYLTWGRPHGKAKYCDSCDTYEGMQDQVTKSYTAFACMFPPGQIAPVGEGFRNIKNNHGDDKFFELYRDLGDDHHASLQGSYLSAAIHYSTLFARPATGNSYTAGLKRTVVQRLQKAADEAVNGRDWHFPVDGKCDDCMCECDLTLPPPTTPTPTTTPMFDCYRNKKYRARGSIIVYNGCEVDTTGGAMDISSGIFTVQEAGTYQITFTAKFNSKVIIDLLVNDEVIGDSQEDGANSSTHTIFVLHPLNSLDTVKVLFNALSADDSYLHSDSDHDIHFTALKVGALH